MSTKRASNKIRTRIKKGPQPIVTRHEREGNMNYFAEEITKSIVDKILSLTITRHFLNDLNPKLPQLCFNNIKREIGKYIHCQFISHDRDDMFFFIRQPQNNAMTDYIRESTFNDLSDFHFDHREEVLLYDNCYDGFNYWGDVSQPGSTRKERNAATQINYARKEPIKKKLEVVFDEQLKTEENGGASPPRNSTQLRNNHPSVRTLIPITLRETGTTSTGKQKNASANIIIHDLPSDKKEIMNEDEDIINFRKEFFDNKETIRLQEEEEVRRLLSEKKKDSNREENNKSQMKNNKIRKNCTNDANCKLVYIKEVLPDALKIEFNMAKSDSREIVMNQDKKQEPFLNKTPPSFISKIKDSVDVSGGIEHKNSNKDNVPSASTKKLNSERFFAVKPIFSSLVYQFAKEEITPSGSSFSLFIPEVGVNILENNQTKIGGRDYYRRYNKYSIENYNQKLRDTLHLSQTAYYQSNSEIDSNSINNINQGDSSMQNIHFNQNISTLFKKSNSNSNINNAMMANIVNKSHMKSLSKSLNSSNSSSNIKLNTSARFLSLRAAIDTLDLINEREEEMKEMERRFGGNKTKQKTNEANLFKKLSHKKMNPNQREEKQSFDEMDKFTKRISMSSLWGNERTGQGNNVPFKMIQRKIRHIKDNDSEGEFNMTRASSLPRIRIKKSFNFPVFNFTQSPIDNFARNNLNKTKYFSKNFFKVN